MMFDEIDAKDALEGLYVNESHRVYRWTDGEGVVDFSITRKGNAVAVHIQTNGKKLRKLKATCILFCDWVFETYAWSDMLVTNVTPEKGSLAKMIKKIGFKELLDHDNGTIYARTR